MSLFVSIKLFQQLSPTFVRRKSKLRAITPAAHQGVSTGTLGAISEDEGGAKSGESIVIQSVEGGENAEGVTEPGVVAVDPQEEMAEEVEDEDDSDIESVMTHDDNLVSMIFPIHFKGSFTCISVMVN